MAELVRFKKITADAYAGLGQNLDKGTIYFITDEGYIIVEGVKYGDSLIKDVVLNDNKNGLVITDVNGDLVSLDFTTASETISGLMSADDKVKLDSMVLIKEINGGTLENGVLTITEGAEYSLVKDESGLVYTLHKNGVATDSIINIPQDQFLKNVSFVTATETDNDIDSTIVIGDPYIKFEWNLDVDSDIEGNQTITFVPVKDLVDQYTAGQGVTITDSNTIFAKVDDSEGNYLELDDKGLRVDSMGANVTNLSKEITIAGGPLAEYVAEAYPDGKVPAGTSIETILMNLICKEIYPTTTSTAGSYSISISAPSITAQGFTNNGLCEVGSTVSFNDITATVVTPSKTSSTVSGLENGYSELDDNSVDSTDKSISKAWSVSQKENSVYKLSASSTGWENPSLPDDVSASTNSATVLSGISLVVAVGENKLSVKETAPAYIGSIEGIPSVFIVSNLGNTDSSKITTTVAAQSNVEKTAGDKTGTFTITGVYPIYANGVIADTDDATAAAMTGLAAPVEGDGTKLNLVKSGTEFAVSFATQSLAPYRIYLGPGQSLKSAYAINPLTNTYATDCLSKFVANGTTVRTIQEKEVTYTIYEWAATEGANRVKFVLN